MGLDQFDVIRLACEFTFKDAGDLQINTYHYEYQDVATLDYSDVFDDLGVIAEELYGNVINTQPPAYKYTNLRAYNLTKDELIGTDTWPAFTAGTGSGELLPPQSCALVIGRTIKSRIQIRKYLGGFLETNQSSGDWTSAMLTALNAFVVDMIRDDIIAALTYTPIAYKASLDRRTDVISGQPISTVRTQRRRTPGRGS